MDEFASEIAAIAADSAHGAAHLARTAAELLVRAHAADKLREVAVEIVRAQPAMASIWNVAHRALTAADAGRDVAAAVRVFPSADGAVMRTKELLAGVSTVMTISRSSTLEQLVQGGKWAVIATESRPLREGVDLAEALARAGTKVTVIADAAVSRYMPLADALVVGADAVRPSGVVNKIGTAPAVLAARAHNKPGYAVCTSDKLLGPGAPQFPDRLRAPGELLPERTAGVAVGNVYFETTPLDWFTAVITENGVIDAGSLDRLRLHPVLAALNA